MLKTFKTMTAAMCLMTLAASLLSGISAFADEPEGGTAGVFYSEDFEDNADEKLLNTISGEADGWSYDGNEDHKDYVNLWIGDNGSGSDNAIRFASTNWYKNMWLNLSLRENGIAKYTGAGYSEAEAEEIVDGYLAEDMSLSFKVKFENQGIDSNSTHEQYIRVKGDRYNVITELRLKDNLLYLSAMNEDRTQNTLYPIGSVDISTANNQWHDIVITTNQENNTYTLTFDGTVFAETPWGADIPAGIASDEDRTIGKVSSMEFGHFWSGWWQCMYLDDIAISEAPKTPVTEWGVSGFEMSPTGQFAMTVSAGEMRYYDTAVYAALYEGDILKDVKVYSSPEFDENASYTVNDSFDVSDAADDLSVKVFIWRDGMRAVTPSYENNIEL